MSTSLDPFQPEAPVDIPDDDRSRPVQVLSPIPGVDFAMRPPAPRTLTKMTGTNRFHVILAFSSAALRSFLLAAQQAFNDLPGIRQQRDDLATEVMRLRALASNPDADMVTPPVIDDSGAIVPESHVTPPHRIIPDDHPQLVTANNERDDALARLTATLTELATAEDTIVRLNEQITQLSATPAPPQPPTPTPAVRPEDSASNIRSDMLINRTITRTQLIFLSFAAYISDQTLLTGSTNTVLGNDPTVQLALDHCSDFAKELSRPGTKINRLSRQCISHYRQHASFDLVPARDLAPSVPHIALFLWILVNSHTPAEITSIATRSHHGCQHGRFCLIEALCAAPTAQSGTPLRPFTAGFYILTITDGIEPRRYPLTVIELLSMIDSIAITRTINDIVRRQTAQIDE
jgi:hypothetical protein